MLQRFQECRYQKHTAPTEGLSACCRSPSGFSLPPLNKLVHNRSCSTTTLFGALAIPEVNITNATSFGSAEQNLILIFSGSVTLEASTARRFSLRSQCRSACSLLNKVSVRPSAAL